MSKVIIGGGLSGLSAAYYFAKKVPGKAITIIESSNRTGGWVKSNRQENGVIFEQGPRTNLPKGQSGQNAFELIQELGLSNQVTSISSNHPAARNRMVYAKGNLHMLPSSFLSIFKKQEPFTKPLISYLLNDMKTKAQLTDDESIYDFTSRRFGTEIADYLTSPLICGICAGNAKEISVNFLMRDYFVYEQEFGSISRGVFHNFLSKKPGAKKYTDNLNIRARREKWNLYSFTDGVETLPKTLTEHVKNQGVNIILNTTCKEITFEDKNKVKVVLNNGETKIADHIVSSVPAKSCGSLVKVQHPLLAELLGRIRNVSVGSVNLFFDQKLIKNEAIGFLVAPKEGLPILAVIYDSCCFPNDNRGTVLTVMMGGYWFNEHFGENPDEKVFLDTALSQLKNILKINEKPRYFKVNILKECLPQYVIGHHRNVWDIKCYIKEKNLPLSLCGASYHGIGMNDVILSAKNAIEVL